MQGVKTGLALGTLAAAMVAAAEISIVPWPRDFKYVGGVYHLNKWANELTEEVFTRVDDKSVPAEGYELSVKTNGITVRCSDDAGAFYALQTLRQIAEAPEWEWTFEALEIKDAPRFPWRGIHLDESRHFFGREVVKKLIDTMSYYKFNVLHWHLVDNDGWRLQIDAFPKLTAVGATRTAPARPMQKWIRETREGGTAYGPYFYTKAEVREILAYAKSRHVTVVPEIEIPGHSKACLAAHPEMLCFREGDRGAPTNRVDNVFCVGNPKSFAFFEKVLDEVCELFPSEVIHIGGDEVSRNNWKACPKCNGLMRERGLKDYNELQAHMMRHFVAYLAKKGRRSLGWDEILDGGLADGAMVMSWRGPEGGIAASKAGHDVIMNPWRFCYLDYPQGLADGTEPVEWAWFTKTAPITLAKAHAFDPLEGIAPECQSHVKGGEALNWAECTATPAELEWKLWPRACALAEVFWSGPRARPYHEFEHTMAAQRVRLVKWFGVNCAPLK